MRMPRLLLGATLVLASLVPATSAPAPAVEPPPLGGGLPGFDSPYLGHTGSGDGQGGVFAASLDDMLDAEVAMGLKWDHVPIWWKEFEWDRPTSHDDDPRGTWATLDQYMRETHERGLNVLLQITVGGNGGGPPDWAGRRAAAKSAPVNMGALVDFAGKLVARYKPGGSLAQQEGWTDGWGVRAWEMDNEPGSYRDNWDTIDDDYAEFVVLTADRIKSIDPLAVIVAPSQGPGGDDNGGNRQFTNNVLDKRIQEASEQHRAAGIEYAIGPATDAVAFHSYEQLDALFDPFNGAPIERMFNLIRSQYAAFEDQPGWEYAPKSEFWHTEGGFDYSVGDPPGTATAGIPAGTLPETGYRASWVLQWFARGFSVGITKLTVMDAHLSQTQMAAVRTQTRLLPGGFTVQDVTAPLGYSADDVSVYRYTRPDGSWVYVAWRANGSFGSTTVTLPVRTTTATLVSRGGNESPATVTGGTSTVSVQGGTPFSEPVFLVEG